MKAVDWFYEHNKAANKIQTTKSDRNSLGFTEEVNMQILIGLSIHKMAGIGAGESAIKARSRYSFQGTESRDKIQVCRYRLFGFQREEPKRRVSRTMENSRAGQLMRTAWGLDRRGEVYMQGQGR